MKPKIFFLLNAVHFLVRKWDFEKSRDMIDTLATDNGNLFLTRHNKMQWLRPLTDRPILHLEREFPRTIQRLSVKKNALLVNMVPDDRHHVSETMVFAKNKCFRSKWKDNTMFEAVVQDNGYLLRSNYFGNITYGNHESLFTYNTRTYTNITYSAMFLYDKYLWCATEYRNKDNVLMTRVDAFDLFVRLSDDRDHIASVPDMTFLLENKGCVHPCQLWVSVENYFPKQMVYLVVGYMVGGVNVAQAYYPPEKKPIETMTSHIPNEKTILSLAFDMPYLFFLDEDGISSYRIHPRADIHRYIGQYRPGKKYFSGITQIVSIKKQVFWNGEQILHSAEIVEE